MAASDRAAAADRFATALAAVIMAGAGVALVFAAIRFAAVAAGSQYSPWRALGLPTDHGGRIALLVLAFVVALLLLAAGLRRRDPVLRFAYEGGDVRVRASALEETIRIALSSDPDVLRIDSRVRLRRGKLHTEVELSARPLADVRRLRDHALDGTRVALCEGAGLPASAPEIDVRAVGVRELRKFL